MMAVCQFQGPAPDVVICLLLAVDRQSFQIIQDVTSNEWSSFRPYRLWISI
jgi:hypothetical protein